MSNTTSLGDKAICNELSATQLGSVSKPVDTAYITNIIPHPSLSTPNLQNVTNEGNTTTNGIVVNDVTATGLNGSGNALQGGGNIVSDTGDIIASGGNLSAPSGFVTGTNVTATTGDVRAVAGDVIANGDITATTGDITATAGDVNGVVVEASDEVKAQNDIISDTGDIKATNGSLTAGNLISAVGKITAGTSMTAGTAIIAGTGMTCTTGSITCVAGNVSASRDISGTTLTVSNADLGTPVTTLSAPANPASPTWVFDMTNKSRGSYWLWSNALTISLTVETGIPRVIEATGILVTFTTGAPPTAGSPYVTDYILSPGNTSTEFILDITTSAATVPAGTPIRAHILLMRD